MYRKGQDIRRHLQLIQRIFLNCKISSSEKTSLLLNSLNDDVQFELYAHPDYNENQNDVDWINTTLIKLETCPSISPWLIGTIL